MIVDVISILAGLEEGLPAASQPWSIDGSLTARGIRQGFTDHVRRFAVYRHGPYLVTPNRIAQQERAIIRLAHGVRHTINQPDDAVGLTDRIGDPAQVRPSRPIHHLHPDLLLALGYFSLWQRAVETGL